MKCSFEGESSLARVCLCAEERRRESSAIDSHVRGDIAQDAGERPHSQAAVFRDRNVMLAALLRRETHVAPSFARDLVAVPAEGAGEVAP